jgi:hypothetical protein
MYLIGQPRVDWAMPLGDGISQLVAFHCREFFTACCLPRHSGLLGFVLWPVGNDRANELVQKVKRVGHGL